MFTLPFDTVYKNIFTLILIILFIFFFSSDPSWNQSFFQKNGLTSIFVILLIYLVYHNFNLSLYFIPFFLLYLIYSKNILQSLKNHFYSSTTNILPTIQETPSTNQLLPNIEEEKSTEILELKKEEEEPKVLSLEDLQELYFSIKNELDELEENDKKS
jgi:hypothetical protein